MGQFYKTQVLRTKRGPVKIWKEKSQIVCLYILVQAQKIWKVCEAFHNCLV